MDKNHISDLDIKEQQFIGWFIAGLIILIILIPSTFMMIFNFSFSGAFLFIIGVTFILSIQYFQSKVWNIWYEGDELFFENIYKTHKRDIELFKVIEQRGFIIVDHYILYLSNGESYYFRINLLDDLRLFFKNDRNFYANRMNEKIKNHIRTQKGHILLD